MENIYLIGSDDVYRAATIISSAGSDMQGAANSITESVCRFQGLVERLEILMDRAINELPQGE